MFLGHGRRSTMAMNCRRFRIKAMHEIKVVLRFQSLLLAYDHELMLVDGSFDLLEIFLANIVQVDALDICSELLIVIDVSNIRG
jgi:hypothetical protein